MGGFRVDSSIRHLACGFAPAHSLGAVDLLAERDPPCRDRRDLRSNAFFVQPEDYHPTFAEPRLVGGKAQCAWFSTRYVFYTLRYTRFFMRYGKTPKDP